MAIALQVIGHKKSGKTTVMCQLLQAAEALHLAVAAIKHTHETPVPTTDSARLATLAPSWLLTPTQTQSYQPDTRSLAARVAAIVDASPQAVVLIEGGKALAYPKLVMLRPDETPASWAHATNVSAFARLTAAVGDTPAMASDAGAAWLQTWLATQGGC